MKTIEEIIDETNNCDFSEMGDPLYDYEQVLEIAKKYAMQEVRKHLEIAANKATFETENIESKIVNTYRIKVIHELRISVNKESIINIKINLT